MNSLLLQEFVDSFVRGDYRLFDFRNFAFKPSEPFAVLSQVVSNVAEYDPHTVDGFFDWVNDDVVENRAAKAQNDCELSRLFKPSQIHVPHPAQESARMKTSVPKRMVFDLSMVTPA